MTEATDKARQIIHEVLATEKNYLETIHILINEYYEPLLALSRPVADKENSCPGSTPVNSAGEISSVTLLTKTSTSTSTSSNNPSDPQLPRTSLRLDTIPTAATTNTTPSEASSSTNSSVPQRKGSINGSGVTSLNLAAHALFGAANAGSSVTEQDIVAMFQVVFSLKTVTEAVYTRMKILDTEAARGFSTEIAAEILADAILCHRDALQRAYHSYMNRVDDMQKTAESLRTAKTHREFLDATDYTPRAKRMALKDLLAEPGQRLMRYGLLLRELYRRIYPDGDATDAACEHLKGFPELMASLTSSLAEAPAALPATSSSSLSKKGTGNLNPRTAGSRLGRAKDAVAKIAADIDKFRRDSDNTAAIIRITQTLENLSSHLLQKRPTFIARILGRDEAPPRKRVVLYLFTNYLVVARRIQRKERASGKKYTAILESSFTTLKFADCPPHSDVVVISTCPPPAYTPGNSTSSLQSLAMASLSLNDPGVASGVNDPVLVLRLTASDDIHNGLNNAASTIKLLKSYSIYPWTTYRPAPLPSAATNNNTTASHTPAITTTTTTTSSLHRRAAATSATAQSSAATTPASSPYASQAASQAALQGALQGAASTMSSTNGHLNHSLAAAHGGGSPADDSLGELHHPPARSRSTRLLNSIFSYREKSKSMHTTHSHGHSASADLQVHPSAHVGGRLGMPGTPETPDTAAGATPHHMGSHGLSMESSTFSFGPDANLPDMAAPDHPKVRRRGSVNSNCSNNSNGSNASDGSTISRWSFFKKNPFKKSSDSKKQPSSARPPSYYTGSSSSNPTLLHPSASVMGGLSSPSDVHLNRQTSIKGMPSKMTSVGRSRSFRPPPQT